MTGQKTAVLQRDASDRLDVGVQEYRLQEEDSKWGKKGNPFIG
jgi:hypothetical protein